LCAVNYIHQKKICHRDIKPENILISEDGTLKLIDFGFAVNLEGTDGTIRGGVGTQTYQAPEVLIGVPYDPSVDLWAVGATTYTLLSGIKPFDYGPHESNNGEPSPEQKSHQRGLILNGEYNFNDPVWEKISPEAKDFLTKLLKVRPGDRISAKAALEHPWIISGDDLRSFNHQWKITSRSRRETSRREKRRQRITGTTSSKPQNSEPDRLSSSLSEAGRDYGYQNRRQKSHSVGINHDSFDTSRATRTATPSALTRAVIYERPERETRTERPERSEKSYDRTADRTYGSRTDRSTEKESLRSNYTPTRTTSTTSASSKSRNEPSALSTSSRTYRSDVRSNDTTYSSSFQTSTRKYRI